MRSDGLKVERTTIVVVPGYCLQFKGQQIRASSRIPRALDRHQNMKLMNTRRTVGRRQRRSAGSLDDERGQEKPSVGAHVWGWSCRGMGLGCGGVHWQCSPQRVNLPNRMEGQLQLSHDTRNWPKSWVLTNTVIQMLKKVQRFN